MLHGACQDRYIYILNLHILTTYNMQNMAFDFTIGNNTCQHGDFSMYMSYTSYQDLDSYCSFVNLRTTHLLIALIFLIYKSFICACKVCMFQFATFVTTLSSFLSNSQVILLLLHLSILLILALMYSYYKSSSCMCFSLLVYFCLNSNKS